MAEEKITELTAEAIRKSGLEVADNIRSYASKVRDEGESMAKYADEVANAVIEASSHAADRISAYMQRCEDARQVLAQHEKLLTSLPAEVQQPEIEPRGNNGPAPTMPQPRRGEFSMVDLERSLQDMSAKRPRP